MTWPYDLQTKFCQYIGIPLDRPHWKTTWATSTLGCHWNNTGWYKHPVVSQWRSSVNLHNWNTLKTTGVTNTLGCDWNQTGWCKLPVVSQWRPSVNLHSWNTLEDHWKGIARPLETHWLPTILSPVAFQCTLGSKLQAHWIASGMPLDCHWLRVRAAIILL